MTVLFAALQFGRLVGAQLVLRSLSRHRCAYLGVQACRSKRSILVQNVFANISGLPTVFFRSNFGPLSNRYLHESVSPAFSWQLSFPEPSV